MGFVAIPVQLISQAEMLSESKMNDENTIPLPKPYATAAAGIWIFLGAVLIQANGVTL